MAKQEYMSEATQRAFQKAVAAEEQKRLDWHRLCLACREFGIELPDFAGTFVEAAVLAGYSDDEIAPGKITFTALRRRLRVWAAERKLGQEWSEAKSPAEWRKQLRISETTFRRHEQEGKLVVDRTISPKKVRIRLDTLRRYLGNE